MTAERETAAPVETPSRKTYRRDGLCPDCGTAPRTKKGYCPACWSARSSRYQRQKRERGKREAATSVTPEPETPTVQAGPPAYVDRPAPEPVLRIVPAKPVRKPVLADGCRAADALVAREVFGYEVEDRRARSRGTWSAGSGGAGDELYYASGPFAGGRLHDLTTSTTAMWLIPRRMAELGLAEEFASWLALSLRAEGDPGFRGDVHALLYGPVPAPLVFARAALEVVRELGAVAP